jgi:AcrR family transcriptional regulator
VASQRLSAADRRAALVAAGARAFAARPYQDVEMTDVARAAGVSRALLYRHFPSKQELFAAVYRAAAQDLLAASVLPGERPLREEVAEGLDAHLRYFEENRHAVLAANRTLAGDPVVAAIISDELAVLRDRLVDVLTVGEAERAVVSTVVLSWLTFVRVLCIEWLSSGVPSRSQVLDICLRALIGALEPVLPSTP